MGKRLRGGIGGAAVGAFAVIALFSTAWHATTSGDQQVTPHAIAQAQVSDDYFNCLDAQAHSLVGPHDVVYVAQATLSHWVTITKVIGGWAQVTLHRDKATVALDLEHIGGSGTCAGDALVSIRHGADGRMLLRRGRQSSP